MQWSCGSCTFSNHIDVPICEMCGIGRQHSSPQSESASQEREKKRRIVVLDDSSSSDEDVALWNREFANRIREASSRAPPPPPPPSSSSSSPAAAAVPLSAKKSTGSTVPASSKTVSDAAQTRKRKKPPAPAPVRPSSSSSSSSSSSYSSSTGRFPSWADREGLLCVRVGPDTDRDFVEHLGASLNALAKPMSLQNGAGSPKTVSWVLADATADGRDMVRTVLVVWTADELYGVARGGTVADRVRRLAAYVQALRHKVTGARVTLICIGARERGVKERRERLKNRPHEQPGAVMTDQELHDVLLGLWRRFNGVLTFQLPRDAEEAANLVARRSRCLQDGVHGYVESPVITLKRPRRTMPKIGGMPAGEVTTVFAAFLTVLPGILEDSARSLALTFKSMPALLRALDGLSYGDKIKKLSSTPLTGTSRTASPACAAKIVACLFGPPPSDGEFFAPQQ